MSPDLPVSIIALKLRKFDTSSALNHFHSVHLWRPFSKHLSHLSVALVVTIIVESPQDVIAVERRNTNHRLTKTYQEPYIPALMLRCWEKGLSTMSAVSHSERRHSPVYHRWIRQTTKFHKSSRNLIYIWKHNKADISLSMCYMLIFVCCVMG